MSEEENGDKPVALPYEIDYDELEKKLRELVDNYLKALEFVDQLSGQVVFRKVKDVSFRYTQQYYEKVNPSAVIIKPITRMYVETHIRSRLKTITGNRKLMIAGLRFSNGANGAPVKNLNKYIKELEYATPALFSWGRLKPFFGYLPAALTLVSPLIFGKVIGVDTSPLSIGNWINDLLKTIERSEWLTLVVWALGTMLISLGLATLFGRFGFQPKRAIFAGGIASIGLDRPKYITMRNWEKFPEKNLYHLEKEVFELVHSNKPKEFPVDLAFDTGIILWLHFTFFFYVMFRAGQQINLPPGEEYLLTQWLIFFIIAVLILCYFIYCAMITYRTRRRDGNL